VVSSEVKSPVLSLFVHYSVKRLGERQAAMMVNAFVVPVQRSLPKAFLAIYNNLRRNEEQAAPVPKLTQF